MIKNCDFRKPGEYESVLSRALSLRKKIPTFNRENTTTTTNDSNSNSNKIGAESNLSFKDSLTAAAESTLNNFINQLDLTLSAEPSTDSTSSSSVTPNIQSQQKQKHNLFAKLESQSLSISKALFGTTSPTIDDDCDVFASNSPNSKQLPDQNFSLDDNESSLLDDRMISSKSNSTTDPLPDATTGPISTNGSCKS